MTKKILAGIFAFSGLFIFGACQKNCASMPVPENHLQIQLAVSESNDILSASVSVGLTEDEMPYEYRLFVYNKRDSVSTEKWLLLKEIGLYSSIYRYTIRENEIDYRHNEILSIPKQILYDHKGTVCFTLVGDVFIGDESSIQIKQTKEFNYHVHYSEQCDGNIDFPVGVFYDFIEV